MERIEESAVLLGLAEVKVPLKNLTQEDRIRMSHICYRKLLEIDSGETDAQENNLRCIGVVDSFYALQEVLLTIRHNSCHVYKKTEVILHFDVRDVLVALPAQDYQSRIIIMSHTQSFGKTALVLQVRSKDVAQHLVKTILPSTQPFSNTRNQSNSKGSSPFRRGADSFGKGMGKKMNNFLSNLRIEKSSKQPVSDTLSVSTVSSDQFISDDEDDDSLNESDDSEDSFSTQKYMAKVAYESRPNFDKDSMSSLEAEIHYLIQSEERFVEDLKALVDFKNKLFNHSNLIKKKHTEMMMKYVQEMLTFHDDLFQQLKECEKTADSLCLLFRKNEDSFKFHVLYISNIPNVERVYRSYCEILKHTYPSLVESLRKPRMRLNHYILTFESLKKNNIEDTNGMLQTLIDTLKEYLKEADTRLVTDSVTSCPFNLTEFGYLVMNGELWLRKGEGLTKRRYQVLLMEEILVLTKETQGAYEYTVSFNLSEASLGHELRGVMIHIKVKQGAKLLLLIFKTKSINLQQKWIQNIKRQIDYLKHKKSSSNESLDNKNSKLMNIETKAPMENSRNNKENSADLYEEYIPPLAVEMYFRNIINVPPKYQNESYFLLSVQEIKESESLLIRNIDHILNQNKLDNPEILEEIKFLYELHIRYIYPALKYDKENFDQHIIKIFLKHKMSFMKSSEKMLYLATVLKHKCSEIHLMENIFEIVVKNFFRYKNYVSTAPFQSGNHQKASLKEIQDAFENVLHNVNTRLKLKYVPNLPSQFNEKVIIEGFLSINESLENIENTKYVILTPSHTYFLTATKSKCYITMSFENVNGKLGSPSGMASFGVKFSNPGQQKRKLNFTASDVDEKIKWIDGFRVALANEIRKENLSEEETPKQNKAKDIKLDENVLAPDVPKHSLTENKIHKTYIESDL